MAFPDPRFWECERRCGGGIVFPSLLEESFVGEGQYQLHLLQIIKDCGG